MTLIAILCGLCALLLGSPAAASTTEVARVKLQEMSAVELVDTILERDEAVYARDEVNANGTLSIRIGDGATPGGAIVSDVFAMKAPYIRQLRRSEYTVAPYGTATYSNGVWELITRVLSGGSYSASNTGGVTIASALAIARVDGDLYNLNSQFTGDLNIQTYAAVTNWALSGSELSFITEPGVYRVGISNLVVWAWMGSHLLNTTNNAQGATTLVADPEHAASAVPLAWWLSQMDRRYAADWSYYGATQTVDLAWQDVRHNAYVSCVSTGDAGAIAWVRRYSDGSTRELMTLSSTNREYQMIAFSRGTNITIQVDAGLPFSAAPVIQYCSNIVTAAWSNLGTTSDWPTPSWTTSAGVRQWRAFTLSAAIPATANAFFRVSGTAAAAVEALSVRMPLTLPDVGSPSNAPASGVTLYIDAGKLWAVNASTNRVCLTP